MSEQYCKNAKEFNPTYKLTSININQSTQLGQDKPLNTINMIKNRNKVDVKRTTMKNGNGLSAESGKDGEGKAAVKVEYPTCIICINEIKKGAKSLMIACGHMFHYECVEKWLQSEDKCPTCRYVIKKDY